MSTRATYQFKRKHYRDATIYIHHDGYPEGAAHYLLLALEQANGYLSPEAFLRGNDRAEITDSHEAHGDTEYRYTVNLHEGTIEVASRIPGCAWAKYAAKPLADFINPNLTGWHPGVTVRAQGAGRWLTEAMAKAEAEAKRAEATSYRERFPTMVGNQGWNDSEAARAEAFAAQWQVERDANLRDADDVLLAKLAEPAPAVRATLYRLVHEVDGKLDAVDYTDAADFEQMLAASDHPYTGTDDSLRLRHELRGKPTFAGLNGPMWGGEHNGTIVIRYETPGAYKTLSA